MVVAITYGNRPYRKALKLNAKTAKKYGGVDKVYTYTDKDIDDGFRQRYFRILSQKRGNGYWLWKPYFVKRVLEELAEGDYLVYADAGGVYYKDSVCIQIEQMKKEESWLCTWQSSPNEKKYTKRDAFFYMNCDEEYYTDTPQRCGGIFILKKCDISVKFVDEWLGYCEDERILTDMPNQCGLENYDCFSDHRHDQSVFSILCKKYNGEMMLDFGSDYFYRYHHTKYGSIWRIEWNEYWGSLLWVKKVRKSKSAIKRNIKRIFGKLRES